MFMSGMHAGHLPCFLVPIADCNTTSHRQAKMGGGQARHHQEAQSLAGQPGTERPSNGTAIAQELKSNVSHQYIQDQAGKEGNLHRLLGQTKGKILVFANDDGRVASQFRCRRLPTVKLPKNFKQVCNDEDVFVTNKAETWSTASGTSGARIFCVINYDMPGSADEYNARVRISKGQVINFITAQDTSCQEVMLQLSRSMGHQLPDWLKALSAELDRAVTTAEPRQAAANEVRKSQPGTPPSVTAAAQIPSAAAISVKPAAGSVSPPPPPPPLPPPPRASASGSTAAPPPSPPRTTADACHKPEPPMAGAASDVGHGALPSRFDGKAFNHKSYPVDLMLKMAQGGAHLDLGHVRGTMWQQFLAQTVVLQSFLQDTLNSLRNNHDIEQQKHTTELLGFVLSKAVAGDARNEPIISRKWGGLKLRVMPLLSCHQSLSKDVSNILDVLLQKRWAKPDETDPDGGLEFTLLHQAAAQLNVDVLGILLKNKADPLAQSKLSPKDTEYNGFTALHVAAAAAMKAWSLKSVGIVPTAELVFQALINASSGFLIKVPVESRLAEDLLSIQTGLLQAFNRAKAASAAVLERLDADRLLGLLKQPKPNTCAKHLVHVYDEDAVARVLKGIPDSQLGKYTKLAVAMAIATRHSQFLRMVLEVKPLIRIEQPVPGKLPIELFSLLLERGASIQLSAYTGDRRNKTTEVRELLQHHINSISVKDHCHLGVIFRMLTVAKDHTGASLLEGVDLTDNKLQVMPIVRYCSAEQMDARSVVRILLSKGWADPNEKDASGLQKTLLHQAAENVNVGILDILLEHGANPLARLAESDSTEEIEFGGYFTLHMAAVGAVRAWEKKGSKLDLEPGQRIFNKLISASPCVLPHALVGGKTPQQLLTVKPVLTTYLRIYSSCLKKFMEQLGPETLLRSLGLNKSELERKCCAVTMLDEPHRPALVRVLKAMTGPQLDRYMKIALHMAVTTKYSQLLTTLLEVKPGIKITQPVPGTSPAEMLSFVLEYEASIQLTGSKTDKATEVRELLQHHINSVSSEDCQHHIRVVELMLTVAKDHTGASLLEGVDLADNKLQVMPIVRHCSAAQTDVRAVLSMLFKKGLADPNEKDVTGLQKTLLHQAAEKLDVGFLDTLLKHGADPVKRLAASTLPEEKQYSGYFTLHMAAVGAVRAWEESCGKADLKSIQGTFHKLISASPCVLPCVVSAGKTPQQILSVEPLQNIYMATYTDCIQEFAKKLEADTLLRVLDRPNQERKCCVLSLLDASCKHAFVRAIKAMTGPQLDRYKKIAVDMALTTKYTQLLTTLLEVKPGIKITQPIPGTSPVDIYCFLLEHGALVQLTETDKSTEVHELLQHHINSLSSEDCHHHIRVVELMLTVAKDHTGASLLEGVDLADNKLQVMPLLRHCSTVQKLTLEPILELLLEKGWVDSNERESHGWLMTLLHMAAMKLEPSLVQMLLDHGADPLSVLSNQCSTLCNSRSTTLESQCKLSGFTPLHVAITAAVHGMTQSSETLPSRNQSSVLSAASDIFSHLQSKDVVGVSVVRSWFLNETPCEQLLKTGCKELINAYNVAHDHHSKALVAKLRPADLLKVLNPEVSNEICRAYLLELLQQHASIFSQSWAAMTADEVQDMKIKAFEQNNHQVLSLMMKHVKHLRFKDQAFNHDGFLIDLKLNLARRGAYLKLHLEFTDSDDGMQQKRDLAVQELLQNMINDTRQVGCDDRHAALQLLYHVFTKTAIQDSKGSSIALDMPLNLVVLPLIHRDDDDKVQALCHKLLRLLLSKGYTNPNQQSICGSWLLTPLHQAVITKNMAIIETLLRHGADPLMIMTATGSARTSRLTVLHLAAGDPSSSVYQYQQLLSKLLLVQLPERMSYSIGIELSEATDTDGMKARDLAAEFGQEQEYNKANSKLCQGIMEHWVLSDLVELFNAQKPKDQLAAYISFFKYNKDRLPLLAKSSSAEILDVRDAALKDRNEPLLDVLMELGPSMRFDGVPFNQEGFSERLMIRMASLGAHLQLGSEQELAQMSAAQCETAKRLALHVLLQGIINSLTNMESNDQRTDVFALVQTILNAKDQDGHGPMRDLHLPHMRKLRAVSLFRRPQLACQHIRSILELLLHQHCICMDERGDDEYSMTPLHMATLLLDQHMVQLLLNCGADPCARLSHNADTVLSARDSAIHSTSHANKQKDLSGYTALHLAVLAADSAADSDLEPKKEVLAAIFHSLLFQGHIVLSELRRTLQDGSHGVKPSELVDQSGNQVLKETYKNVYGGREFEHRMRNVSVEEIVERLMPPYAPEFVQAMSDLLVCKKDIMLSPLANSPEVELNAVRDAALAWRDEKLLNALMACVPQLRFVGVAFNQEGLSKRMMIKLALRGAHLHLTVQHTAGVTVSGLPRSDKRLAAQQIMQEMLQEVDTADSEEQKKEAWDLLSAVLVAKDQHGLGPFKDVYLPAAQMDVLLLLQRILAKHKPGSEQKRRQMIKDVVDIRVKQGQQQETQELLACVASDSSDAALAVATIGSEDFPQGLENSWNDTKQALESLRTAQVVESQEQLDEVNKSARNVLLLVTEASKAQRTAQHAAQVATSQQAQGTDAEFEGSDCEEGEQEYSDDDDLPFVEGNIEQPQTMKKYESLEEVVHALQHLEWKFIITEEARQGWATMLSYGRKLAGQRLLELGSGMWQRSGGLKRLTSDRAKGLELWRIKINKGGRIIFDVTEHQVLEPSSSSSYRWEECIRLWCITLDHNEYERKILSVQEAFRRSLGGKQGSQLQLREEVATGATTNTHFLRSRPRRFHEEVTSTTRISLSGRTEKQQPQAPALSPRQRCRQHITPVSHDLDHYGPLKMYNVDELLLNSIVQGLGDDQVSLCAKPGPEELEVIEYRPNTPSSMILHGRSGTGKTTCAVHRLFAQWLHGYRNRAEHALLSPEEAAHAAGAAVFITANGRLLKDVKATFRRMQRAILSKQQFNDIEIAGGIEYDSFEQVPQTEYWKTFPMFLRSDKYLEMLDASVKKSFLTHRQPGVNQGGSQSMKSESKQERITWEQFQEWWPDICKIASKKKQETLNPSLVWAEICSHIKGSVEALQCKDGILDLAKYLTLGRKRTYNFSEEQKEHDVWPLFQAYEVLRKSEQIKPDAREGKQEKARSSEPGKAIHQAIKSVNKWYDVMEFVYSLYQQIREGVQDGSFHVPFVSLYRDEVQDFTQAELALDITVMSNNPNNIFYCGDTAQCIARGIAFRFKDVTALFEQTNQMAQSNQVGVPVLKQLKVNYRTHQGILDTAAVVVDLIKTFYPESIDKLCRETAQLNGPGPLLLGQSVEALELFVQKDFRTGEFVFNDQQAVIVRSKDSVDKLPEELRGNQELKIMAMTVEEAKGLEYEDVFVFNFFADSPMRGSDWRTLNNFLLQFEKDTFAAKASSEGVTEDEKELFESYQKNKDKGLKAGGITEFNTQKHVMLQEELKQLYTAITRAKGRVIFFDTSLEKSAPFFNIMTSLGLARVVDMSSIDGVGAGSAMFGSKLEPAHAGLEHSKMAKKLASVDMRRASRLFGLAQDNARMEFYLAQHLLSIAEGDVKLLGSDEYSNRSPAHLLIDAAFKVLLAIKHAEVNNAKAKGVVDGSPSLEYLRVDGKEIQRWRIQAAELLKRCGMTADAKQMYSVAGRYCNAQLTAVQDIISRTWQKATKSNRVATEYFIDVLEWLGKAEQVLNDLRAQLVYASFMADDFDGALAVLEEHYHDIKSLLSSIWPSSSLDVHQAAARLRASGQEEIAWRLSALMVQRQSNHNESN